MKRPLSVVVGLLFLATGAVLVVAPGLLPPAADPIISALDRQKRMALAGIGAFILFAAAISGAGTKTRPSPVPETDPETVATDETPLLGEYVDTTVTSLSDFQAREESHKQAVYDDLRAVVVGHVQRTQGCDRDTAERAVAEGEWTDNATVAAFLADDQNGPWLTWLLDWLRYEPVFVRRVRRTLDELERQRSEEP